MKKIVGIILIIITLFAFGNIDYTELNNIGIVDMIGISKKNNNYLVYIKLLTPTKEDEKAYKMYEINTKDLNNIENELYLRSDKKIFLSHLNLLILDNDLTKNNYQDIFNYFLEQETSRNNFNIISLHNFNTNIFKEDSLKINNLINNNYQEEGCVYPVFFNELYKEILDSNTSYLPRLSYDKGFKLKGMKIIYAKDYNLSLNDSLILTLLKNKTKHMNLIVNNEIVRVNKIDTLIETNKDKVTITITSNINSSRKIKDEYEKYLKDKILFFLDKKDNSYILNLIKKENYDYYKENKIIDIKYEIKIKTILNNISNTKVRD